MAAQALTIVEKKKIQHIELYQQKGHTADLGSRNTAELVSILEVCCAYC
jgi:hypothetical protein